MKVTFSKTFKAKTSIIALQIPIPIAINILQTVKGRITMKKSQFENKLYFTKHIVYETVCDSIQMSIFYLKSALMCPYILWVVFTYIQINMKKTEDFSR